MSKKQPTDMGDFEKHKHERDDSGMLIILLIIALLAGVLASMLY